MNHGKILCLIFCAISINGFTQQINTTFKKSPKNYKYIAYLFNDSDTTQRVIDFQIYVKKASLHEKHSADFLVYFGSKQLTVKKKDLLYEKVNLNLDTIFYQRPGEKKILCVLDGSAKDTIFIENFGSIHNHYFVLQETYYYSKIKDTVYNFCLGPINNLKRSENQFQNSAEYDYYQFKSIGLSKKYGFIWVNYGRYHEDIWIAFH